MNHRPSYSAKRAARKAARIAAENLGLTGELLGRPTFSIRWVDPSEIGGSKGEVRGGDEHHVLVRNDLSPREAVKTVFHEARHLDQLRRGEMPAFEARLSREKEEELERVAEGRQIYLWRKHRDDFFTEPWFPDGDEKTTR